MSIIAVYSIKGGVGKTVTAVNLAYLSALEGARTLLWDLDPQGAATFHLRVRPKVVGGGRKLFAGEVELERSLKGSDYPGLDLLPAEFSYRHTDFYLESAKKPHKRLSKMLRPLGECYEHVFLDCAPSASLTAESVHAAADLVLVPTIPTPLALRALSQVLGHLKRLREKGHVPPVMPFFSMVDRRKALHREVCDYAIEQELGFAEAAIPYSSLVERMGVQRAPLPTFSRSSNPTRAFAALWQEVRERLESGVEGDAPRRGTLKKLLRRVQPGSEG